MEGIDHHLGGLIRRQGRQQLPPQLLPRLIGEQIASMATMALNSGL